MVQSDKYHNWIPLEVTQASADAFAIAEIDFPEYILSQKYLLEITKLKLELPRMPITITSNQELFITLTTNPNRTSVGNLTDPDIIFRHVRRTNTLATAEATEFAITSDDVLDVSLTDDEGKGVLVAPQDLGFATNSTNTGNSNTIQGRMYFRLVKVSERELLDTIRQQSVN